MLYTVNKKGKVLAQAKLKSRKGRINTISNSNKYSIYAYTNGGSTSFSHATTDFRQGNFSTANANYSFDGDGTYHKKKGAGASTSMTAGLQPSLLPHAGWSLGRR